MYQITLLLLLIMSQASSADADAEVNRLIRQLGAESFAEREAATRALHALGEKALESLRAAKHNSDPEVKRRVSGLLKPLEAKVRRREIEVIRDSKLPPVEKGRRLKGVIQEGMTKKEIERLLGGFSEWKNQRTTLLSRTLSAYYKKYGLWIHYEGQEELRVSRIELEPKAQ